MKNGSLLFVPLMPLLVLSLSCSQASKSPDKSTTPEASKALKPARQTSAVDKVQKNIVQKCRPYKKSRRKKGLAYAAECARRKNWSAVNSWTDFFVTVEKLRPYGHYYRSLQHGEKNEFRAAHHFIQLSLDQVTDEPLFDFQKARVLWSQGEYTAAEVRLRELLSQSPEFKPALQILAQIESSRSNCGAAIEKWHQANAYDAPSASATQLMLYCHALEKVPFPNQMNLEKTFAVAQSETQSLFQLYVITESTESKSAKKIHSQAKKKLLSARHYKELNSLQTNALKTQQSQKHQQVSQHQEVGQ